MSLFRSHSTRQRTILLASGLTAAVLALSACGGGSGSSSEHVITYAGWGGSGQDALTPAFFKPFTAATGIKVISTGPVDYSKIQQMSKAGNVTWDVAQIDPDFGLTDSPYLDKIDCAQVGCSDLTVGGLHAYPQGAPLMTFSTVLTYNTKTFPSDPPQTWNDFFNVTKYPGKRAVMTNLAGGGNGTLEIALLASGVEPSQLYPLDMDKALAKINSIRKDIVFIQTNQQCVDLVSRGDAVMGNCLNGDAAAGKAQGDPIAWSWDQQILFADYLSVVKGSPHEADAMKLIQWMTSKEHNGELADNIAYGPSNTKSLASAKTARFADSLPSLHVLSGTNAPIPWNGQWWYENAEQVNHDWLNFTSQ
jgi:putative spermidine/putrescine transport system substrate-binding protein